MSNLKLPGFGKHRLKPSKIVCVGRNYVAHIEELGNETPEEMVVFVKPNSSISSDLHATHAGEALHYEGELCFLHQNGRFSGIGFGLDLTKRALQGALKNKGLPWERAKGFNGAAVFSEFMAMPDSLDNISFELNINGKLQQTGNYDLMITKPGGILDEVTSFMALYDGDIVMTGTPKGVGCVNAGDLFEASVYNSEKRIVSATWRAI